MTTAKTVRFSIEIPADLAAAINGAAKANNVVAEDIVNDCVRGMVPARSSAHGLSCSRRLCRLQAEIPLIALCRFPGPAQYPKPFYARFLDPLRLKGAKCITQPFPHTLTAALAIVGFRAETGLDMIKI
jgi:hypothetical protein